MDGGNNCQWPQNYLKKQGLHAYICILAHTHARTGEIILTQSNFNHSTSLNNWIKSHSVFLCMHFLCVCVYASYIFQVVVTQHLRINTSLPSQREGQVSRNPQTLNHPIPAKKDGDKTSHRQNSQLLLLPHRRLPVSVIAEHASPSHTAGFIDWSIYVNTHTRTLVICPQVRAPLSPACCRYFRVYSHKEKHST